MALCFAVLSWTLCLQIFGNPEVPRNYRILQVVGRAPEFKPFTMAKLPAGGALGPKDLYSLCVSQSKHALDELNVALLKNYLAKCSSTKMLKFVEGEYQLESVRPLGRSDFLSRGVGLRLRSMVKPDEFTPPTAFPVVLDVLVPTDASPNESVIGQTFELTRKPHALALIHLRMIRQQDEPAVCVTAVPIAATKLPFGGQDSPPWQVLAHGTVQLEADQPLF